MSRIDYSKWDKLEIEDSSDSSSSSDDDDKEEAVSRSTTRRGSSLKMFENALDHSEKLRKAGNTLFEKNQKKNAKTLYLQALSILQPLQNIRDTNLREKWKNEIVKNHLNIAAIAGESENFAEVVRHAEVRVYTAAFLRHSRSFLHVGALPGGGLMYATCMERCFCALTLKNLSRTNELVGVLLLSTGGAKERPRFVQRASCVRSGVVSSWR